MNTGQTMLTIMALAMLSVITMSYYASIGQSARSLSQSNAGLTATTIATSFVERAQSTAFDEISDTTSIDKVIHDPGVYLTAYDSLGTENANERTCIDSLDDFDDFNGWTEDYTPGWMNELYRVRFKVYYVDPNNVNTNTPSTVRTFVKKMDITVWRVDATSAPVDTFRLSTLFGYYRYN